MTGGEKYRALSLFNSDLQSESQRSVAWRSLSVLVFALEALVSGWEGEDVMAQAGVIHLMMDDFAFYHHNMSVTQQITHRITHPCVSVQPDLHVEHGYTLNLDQILRNPAVFLSTYQFLVLREKSSVLSYFNILYYLKYSI